MTTILIMCQGEQRRLADLGHPKQLLVVDGETILGRTIRLCDEIVGGAERLFIVGKDERLVAVAANAGATTLSLHDPGFCVLDGIEATRPSWNWPVATSPRVRVLLGDVVWSRPALEALLLDTRRLVFAGTSDVSASTGEIFGMSFSDLELVADLLRTAPCRVRGPRQTPIRYPKQQGGHLRRLLWHAMQRFQLLPELRQHTWHPSLYIPIDDWTDDIDTVGDVERLPRLELEVRAERTERALATVATMPPALS